MNYTKNRRILIIDDNRAIHDDFHKLLDKPDGAVALRSLDSALFGSDQLTPVEDDRYEINSAFQGEEGWAMVRRAVEAGQPYALAFVDMRMPPGWDGVQTIEKIWQVDPDIQIVICSAYSDYSWEDILKKFGPADRLLILRKPFDMAEVCQLACALTEKWHLAKYAHLKISQLKAMVDQQTHDLQATNRSLEGEILIRHRSEYALRQSEEQYRATFELAGVGKAQTDLSSGRFTRVNRKMCDITGYCSDELLSMNDSQITHPDDRDANLAHFQRLVQGDNAETTCEKRYVRKDGQTVWVQVTATLLQDTEGQNLSSIAVIQDVTDRRMAEEQLRHDAFHDTLTGLANRALLTDRLQRCLLRVKRHPERAFALLFIDLDRFKVINDSLGHIVGDKLLIAMSSRLAASIRELDTLARVEPTSLARVGGDEFVLLLEEIGNKADAIRVADRLQHAMTQPFNLDGHEVFSSGSMGLAISHPGYERPEEILRDADAAMYQAKAAAKGGYRIFDPTMHASAMRRWQMENDLRSALERGEFRLQYQPILSLRTEQVVAFEALVRWHHPDCGMISPAEFIPLAEETGLILPLGLWVLREACHQLKRWHTQMPEFSALTVSVNVSGKQFAQADLVERIVAILEETSINPHHLKLEITESAVMENDSTAMAGLARLRALDLQFHLDDFGTGYSSLSYLHRMPIGGLKIDRTFVNTMQSEPVSRSIVQAVIALAHTLKMQVIAEGVETRTQIDTLREFGCDCAQGFYFSKPLDVNKVFEFLATRQSIHRALSA